VAGKKQGTPAPQEPPMRRTALALALSLAPLTAAAEMTDAERKAFRAEVRAYLLENPEVLMEAIGILEERQAQAEAAADLAYVADNRAAIFEDGHSWVGGNPQGDVTVVEFIDYRCGYCRRANAEVEELVRSDGNIRFVVKEFPILGPESDVSARFAVAVLQLHPGRYEEAHDRLIALRGEATRDSMGRLAQDMGLDPAPLLARMQAPEVTAVIQSNHALADRMQISGTPTFVIGGRMLRGYVPLEGMRAIVAEERG
jgi:protein-disulfide isomerase